MCIGNMIISIGKTGDFHGKTGDVHRTTGDFHRKHDNFHSIGKLMIYQGKIWKDGNFNWKHYDLHCQT